MKILIVDDYRLKIEKIENFIMSNINCVEVFKSYSYHSGLEAILNRNFDLILLDMSMPTFDITSKDNGGQLKRLAGKDIMRYMKRKQKFVPVIIITQYDTLGKQAIADIVIQLKEKYSEFYIGTVYYDSFIENWKSDLLELFSKVRKVDKNENIDC